MTAKPKNPARPVAGLIFDRDGADYRVLVEPDDDNDMIWITYGSEEVVGFSPDEWMQIIPLIEGIIGLPKKGK